MDVSTSTDSATAKAPAVIPTALDRKPVDGVEVARQLKRSNRYGALNPHARLEAGLDAMSLEEVDAALVEIAAAPLTDDDRKLLHERFCEVLSRFRNGPELVLERFVPLIEKGLQWTLGGYFARWMELYPDQALVWLGKNSHQINDFSFGFLEPSFFPLLAKSPATAGRLLEALPPERRLDAMRSLSIPGMSPEQHITWASVVRKHIPADQRLQAVAWPTMLWSDGDGAPMTMTQVAAYLRRIDLAKYHQPEP